CSRPRDDPPREVWPALRTFEALRAWLAAYLCDPATGVFEKRATISVFALDHFARYRAIGCRSAAERCCDRHVATCCGWISVRTMAAAAKEALAILSNRVAGVHGAGRIGRELFRVTSPSARPRFGDTAGDRQDRRSERRSVASEL